MSKKTRVCYACGKKYEYCPTCPTDSMKPTWMFCFDTEECKEVFSVLSEYGADSTKTTKDDVKKVLDKYNVTDYGKFNETIQKQLKEVTATEKKKTSKKEA